METFKGVGTNVSSNGSGHMTKMVAMPIYGKKLLKSSSPNLEGPLPADLVCNIEDVGPPLFVLMMIQV